MNWNSPEVVESVTILDSSTMNITVCAARVEVERQHPARSRGGIVDRHCARLARGVGWERPGMAGRVGPAAVLRDPDVRSSGDRGRD